MTATKNSTPLPLRNDTVLGVCEAIGQDFGFNPLWLRLAFIAPLFFQPMLTIALYFALGLVVALSRHVAPRVEADVVEIAPQPASEAGANEELKIAA